MPTVRLAAPNGAVICERCELALTPISKFRTLHTRANENGSGLWTKPTTWADTLLRKNAVDVVFFDRTLRVVKLTAPVAPWRIAACRRASAVAELPAGEAGRRGVRLGLRLVSNPNGPS